MPKQTRQLKKPPQVLRGVLPPPEKILDLARECGFVERLRKLHPALLLYTLIFGLSAHQHPTVSEIHRQYKSIDNSRDEEDKIRQQSISNRIDEDMVKFLKLILLSCIDRIASQCSTRLNIRYQTFRTIFILDSTIIRIHAKLAALYQATRTRNGSGGLKISILYNAVAHGLDTISIVPEQLTMSVSTHDFRKSAFYCGDLVMINLMIGDIATAYKYFSDLATYAEGDVKADAMELSEQIRNRMEYGIAEIPDELIQKVEIIVHKVSLRFRK